MAATLTTPNTMGARRAGVFGGLRRRHGASVPFDRAELERSGWRTTLEYRENHVRRRDGRLDHLETVWHAEAERRADDGTITVVQASAHGAGAVWSRLRREADLAGRRPGRDAARAGPAVPPPRRSHGRPGG